MFRWLFVLGVLFLGTSCVQLPVGNQKITPFKNIVFTAPSPDFNPASGLSADRAWINTKTGSLISHKSECPSDQSDLESYLTNLASQFPNLKTLSSQTLKFNNRKANRLVFSGSVEGVETQFDLITFKKYGCLFLISHSGLKSKIKASQKAYETYVNSIRVSR